MSYNRILTGYFTYDNGYISMPLSPIHPIMGTFERPWIRTFRITDFRESKQKLGLKLLVSAAYYQGHLSSFG